MMKISLLLLLVMAGIRTDAQIREYKPTGEWKVIGRVKYAGPDKAVLKFLEGSDTTYLLTFRDDRYELHEYFSISFDKKGGTLFSFYQVLNSFFEEENKKNKGYERTISLGDTMLHLQHYKKIGSTGVMLTTKEGYVILTKNEIRKLFGLQKG